MDSLFNLDKALAFGHTTAAFIVVVGILVFVHEFGHYYIAIRNKVKVETFSIGFGPRLFGWRDKRGTAWQVCLLPLGGYVKMFGDVDPASVGTDPAQVAAMTPEERAQAFFAKPVGVRAAIVAAGPGINFLFSIIVLFLLYVSLGQAVLPPKIGEVFPDKPAAQAGMLAGDTIKQMNGEIVDDFTDIKRILSSDLGAKLDVIVDRDGQEISMTITPEVEDVTNNFGIVHRTGRIGVMAGGEPEFKRLNPLQAVGAAFADTWGLVKSTFTGLYQIIAGERSSKELGGVITIAKVSGDMSHSISSFIWFMAMLSANLGLINLFPIPVLDGGHLVFYAMESVRGRPLSDMAQEYSLRFGLALVLTLTLFALWNDLNNFGVVKFITQLF